MSRGLGFVSTVPVSPSIDPVSIALNVIAGVSALIGLFHRRVAQRQAQQNEVVQVQNQLGANLRPISDAAEASNDPEELFELHDKTQALALDFYNYTKNFAQAGPGARQTIFGDEVEPGVFNVTTAHPGWLTRLLDFIRRKLSSLTGLIQPVLGHLWAPANRPAGSVPTVPTSQPLNSTPALPGRNPLAPVASFNWWLFLAVLAVLYFGDHR